MLWLAFRATRPAFLSVTLSTYLLGIASARYDDIPIDWLKAGLGLLAVLLAHAAGNVWNDVADARNGTDRLNVERVAPFTGGSRMIDEGQLDASQMRRLAVALLLLAMLPGVLLVWQQPVLLPLAVAGVLLSWGYSAPPLWLVARGLGELTVATTWLLVAIGADLVQRESWSATPFWAGTSHALLVAAVLYINQFPDARADAAVGKRTLVVRLGTRRAVAGFPGLQLVAASLVLLGTLLGTLPGLAVFSLLALGPGLMAWQCLSRCHDTPSALAPALRLTIAASLLHGFGLASALFLSG